MKTTANIKLNNMTEVIREICTWLLIVILMSLFFFSGLDKALSFERFQSSLSNSPLIPDRLAWLVGIMVIALLLTSSGLLLVGFWYPKLMKAGLYSYLAIMVGFTIYIIFILFFAEYVPCVCIGITENAGISWLQHLWMNITILLLAGITTWLYKTEANKIIISTNRAKPEAL